MLCHRVKVVKNFRCCTTDCVFCDVIGGCKILPRKQSTLMDRPDVTRPSPLGWGLGTRLCQEWYQSTTYTDNLVPQYPYILNGSIEWIRGNWKASSHCKLNPGALTWAASTLTTVQYRHPHKDGATCSDYNTSFPPTTSFSLLTWYSLFRLTRSNASLFMAEERHRKAP